MVAPSSSRQYVLCVRACGIPLRLCRRQTARRAQAHGTMESRDYQTIRRRQRIRSPVAPLGCRAHFRVARGMIAGWRKIWRRQSQVPSHGSLSPTSEPSRANSQRLDFYAIVLSRTLIPSFVYFGGLARLCIPMDDLLKGLVIGRHCSVCASTQMLRRIILTAESTVTRVATIN